MSELEHIASSQCRLGEGPVWHPTEGVLYWLDIEGHRLHRFDPKTGTHNSTELGLMATAMGIRADGGFIMATKKGFALWNSRGNQFEYLGDPDPDVADNVRLNDGKTDHQGRFWAGKMSNQPNNSLFRVDADHSIHRMDSGIICSNGLGWSPDDRTFYYTDSTARLIYAYDFDAETGGIANRRTFFQVPEGPREGLPDGLAVDEEGCIWSARWGGWKIVRYTPDGQVDREIAMPVEYPTSCAFGGPDLNELYITSAWTEVKPENRASQPLAGDVFCLKTDVKGFPEPFYLG